jgi:hypothetical protein
MITGFASNGVVACVPAPYELLANAPPRDTATRLGNRGKRIPGWTAAAIVVLCAPTSRLADLKPLIPAAIEALDSIQPGQVIRIG